MVMEDLTDGGGLIDADLQLREFRIFKALEIVFAVGARDEDEGRLVDRLGEQNALVAKRQIHQHIALVVAESLAQHAALDIGAPIIFGVRIHRLGEDFANLVLIALKLVVRERHVAGIAAKPQGIELAFAGRGLQRGAIARWSEAEACRAC